MILRFRAARRAVLLGELRTILPAWGLYPDLTGAFACLIGGYILPSRGYPVRLGVPFVPWSPRIFMTRIGPEPWSAWHLLRLADSVRSPSSARRILS